MITKILVPHDGTETSNNALAKAFEFAEAFNAEVVLLHVIKEVPVPPSIMLGNDRVLIAQTKRRVAKQLEKEWRKLAEEKIIDDFSKNQTKKKVNSAISVIHGSPVKEIIKFAKDNKIDIIVMGSRRLENISKIKGLGSVARNVSESATCPVMIVH